MSNWMPPKVKDEIVLSLRQMIWHEVCVNRTPENEVVGIGIISHPRWREYISRLNNLAGESDEDCSSVQGIVPWKKLRRILRSEPDLVEQIELVLQAPSRRLAVCSVLICNDTFEITFLDPLRPSTLN